MTEKNINKIHRGVAGEALASAFLEELGFVIAARNYRYKRAEVDIIAYDGKELVIIEVKMRQNNLFGFPEEAVSARKEDLLKEAGYAYKKQNQIIFPVRFDIVAISLDELEIKHYKDAF